MLEQMPKPVAGARFSEKPMVDGPYAYRSYGPANVACIVVMVVASNEEMRDPGGARVDEGDVVDSKLAHAVLGRVSAAYG